MPHRVIAFIDGFNLHHALEKCQTHNVESEIDIRRLIQFFLTKQCELVDVYYFTASPWWSERKLQQYHQRIRSLKAQDIKIVQGEFRKRHLRCHKCGHVFFKPEEKQTDVNIATKLLSLAHIDLYDTAIIVSADNDLIPAISTVKQHFPEKRIGVVFPPGKVRTNQLRQTADFHSRIKANHLNSCSINSDLS